MNLRNWTRKVVFGAVLAAAFFPCLGVRADIGQHPQAIDEHFPFCPIGWDYELHLIVGQEPSKPLELPHAASPYKVFVDEWMAPDITSHDTFNFICMQPICIDIHTFYPAVTYNGPYNPNSELYRIAVQGYSVTAPYTDMINITTSKCIPHKFRARVSTADVEVL